MSFADLHALLPVLILAFGATAILMAGAWYREPMPLLAGGLLTALLGALSAGLVVPPTPDIAGLFSAGGYARFYTIFWSLLAAVGLMTGSRFVVEKRIGAGEYVALVLYAAAGMALPMRKLQPCDRKRVLAEVPLGFVGSISQGTPLLQNGL